ncbi:MAG: tripartite tricarboxylate transporter substrate binding protein [Betaproteobacteria bacterium]
MTPYSNRDRKPSPFLIIGLLLILSSFLLSVNAQDYPTRPIKIIVPFTPGGGNDVYAREIAQKLTERLGQTVIVDNRPGAGGNIGADLVAKAPADGYTLLLAQNGLTMAPLVSKNVTYDFNKDLSPIGFGATLPLGIAVATSLPIKNMADLIAYAKKNTGKLSYATPGIGTPHHLFTELFLSTTNTQMVHIPYKGAAGMLTDLISNQVQVVFGALNSMLPHHTSGKIRIIALGEHQRNPILKDMPTVNETVPGYEGVYWFGLMATGGTPEAILNKLSEEQRLIVNTPEVRERLAVAGFDINPTSPKEMRKLMGAEYEKWSMVVKSTNIKPE